VASTSPAGCSPSKRPTLASTTDPCGPKQAPERGGPPPVALLSRYLFLSPWEPCSTPAFRACPNRRTMQMLLNRSFSYCWLPTLMLLMASGDSYSSVGFDSRGEQPGPHNPLGNPPFPGHSFHGGPNWVIRGGFISLISGRLAY